MLWQLTQMLWVGGLWLLHVGLLPVLAKIGLAPLLIDEINSLLGSLLIGFAAVCVIVQTLVLLHAEGRASLWRDVRGQLLMLALYACGMYFAVRTWMPGAPRWQLFSYLILALCGLVLVLQPVPGESGRVRTAYP